MTKKMLELKKLLKEQAKLIKEYNNAYRKHRSEIDKAIYQHLGNIPDQWRVDYYIDKMDDGISNFDESYKSSIKNFVVKYGYKIHKDNPVPSGRDLIEYREYHIAYSELRGRTREEIEKPAEGNKPNEELIKKLKKWYGQPDEETLCASA